ncbi:hypothetical protein NAT47_12380 [Flavobacterium sp. HXWNR69]|uniref:Uncharacterized protein n=2 Tax=Flavobacterium TaxID=237 RepID=V6S3J2_9FLAO|nr:MULTISPECIES: hypothetical protein [Flavobacterium]ESU21253.1 hypothetical protein FCR2A7T_06810 [Flavobacterium cauense R2A-7]KGO79305.1 hypothetical protein Q762_14540 [Flavobacterium cauense R2A-7]MCL9771211.1 hypothetical protein [Flavobacterium sp. HXWNR69]TWI07384.1 hypothetical protein IP98_02959 [Flavobacterium cauense R2A-7]
MTQKQKILYQKIDEILWKSWDPIGLNDNENCRSEYQSYTRYIFKLKVEGADKVKISNHLHQLTTVSMGLSGNKKHCDEIAQEIFDLKI